MISFNRDKNENRHGKIDRFLVTLVLSVFLIAVNVYAVPLEYPGAGLSQVQDGVSDADIASGTDVDIVISGSDEPAIPLDGGAYMPSDSDVSSDTDIPGSDISEGWHSDDGVTYYIKNGQRLTGFQRIDGALYYFDVNDGTLLSENGFCNIENGRYYSVGGRLLTGLSAAEGKVYYFDENGLFREQNGSLTVADEARATTDEYYFIEGQALIGITEADGENILYDNFGRRVTADGVKTLYDAASGSLSDYYILGGKAADGFLETDEGLRYYSGGKALEGSGWKEIDGGAYYLENGIVQTGMYYTGSDRYFLSPEDNGKKQTGWLELYGSKYYADANGVIQRGKLFDTDGKSYISDSNGALRYGWIKIGQYEYYADKTTGALAKNTTVDGNKIDANGRKIIDNDSEVIKEAKKLINAAAPKGGTNAEKLRLSYNYIAKNCVYKRDYADPLKLSSNWREKYALEMFKTHRGNCYRYASAFAYVAEALGYDAKVTVGRVAASGGGLTPHAVTEIIINGKTYVCDTNLQRTRSKYNWYMLTYSNYHYKYKKIKTFDVKK